MKTATMIATHFNLRLMRARQLAQAVLERIEPQLQDDCHRDVIEALLELFMHEGVEVITDRDRNYYGLPPRGPEGWTTSELVAVEHARLQSLLRPAVHPLYPVTADRKAVLEEAAAVADRRAAVLKKIPGYRSEETELVTLAAAIRSLA